MEDYDKSFLQSAQDILGKRGCPQKITEYVLLKNPDSIKKLEEPGAKRLLTPLVELVRDPESSYILLSKKLEKVAKSIAAIDELQQQIPGSLQLKVNEINGNLEKAKALMAEVDNDAKEMVAMINKAIKKGSEITETDVKLTKWAKIQLDSDLKTIKDLLGETEMLLKILEVELRAHPRRPSRRPVIAQGVVSAVKGIVSLTSAVRETYDMARGNGDVSRCVLGWASVLADSEEAFYYYKLLEVLHNYGQVLNDCENMKSELAKLNLGWKAQQHRAEKMRDGMTLLE